MSYGIVFNRRRHMFRKVRQFYFQDYLEVFSASTLTFQRWQVIKIPSPACIDLTWNYDNFRSESALPGKPLNILRESERNISARNYDNLKFWRKKRKNIFLESSSWDPVPRGAPFTSWENRLAWQSCRHWPRLILHCNVLTHVLFLRV